MTTLALSLAAVTALLMVALATVIILWRVAVAETEFVDDFLLELAAALDGHVLPHELAIELLEAAADIRELRGEEADND
jgi:hypothetical protein